MERDFAGYLGGNQPGEGIAQPPPSRQEESLPRLDAPLSPAERLAIMAISHGLTEPEAAVVYGVSHETIRAQTKAARRKLAAKTNAQAVYRALKLGLID